MAFRRLFVAALFASVAGCVAAPPQPKPTPPVVTPTPRPSPTPTPVPTYSNWMDVPQTPGDWRYGPVAGGSAATFGDGPANTVFSLQCSAGTQSITLKRNGTFANTAAITIRTESASRGIAGVPMMDNAALRATLSASDPLLDAMAFSKGRFAIEAPGAPALYLPSWPEVTRVIEDCR
jgi:hypothetical protein